eukprot:11671-Heterococcus_DN1.PRE.1
MPGNAWLHTLLLLLQAAVVGGPDAPVTWEHLGDMEVYNVHFCNRQQCNFQQYNCLSCTLVCPAQSTLSTSVASSGTQFCARLRHESMHALHFVTLACSLPNAFMLCVEPTLHYTNSCCTTACRDACYVAFAACWSFNVVANTRVADGSISPATAIAAHYCYCCRFAAPREEHKAPFAYLGFGAGMHQCMGQQFGFLQVKTLVSVLLREYEFELIDKKLPELNYESMVVGPKGTVMVNYKRRTAAAAAAK